MKNNKIATFGGGCFWCIEAIIQRLKGVEKVESGYAGGESTSPNYRSVCSGVTGHAEVIQVSFDADLISYEDLITVFMTSHDPTTLNRQGADKGTQYRSVILYHDDVQKVMAEKVIANLASTFGSPIVTEVAFMDKFYPAETHHQNYYNNNTSAGYCRVVINPKVAKLREKYGSMLKRI